MRLDLFLAEKGYANTRTRAQNLIKLGAVKVNGAAINKPSYEVGEKDAVEVLDIIKYCSLGGLKLERAIEFFKIKLHGSAIDIGASNGGFTDCLLCHGISKVYAVDVGANALPDKLTQDPRVVIMDNTNARNLSPSDFAEKADFITIDVSFISLTLILPIALKLLKDDGRVIALVKPQFEVGRKNLTKNGVVKTVKAREDALKSVISAAANCGLQYLGSVEAPQLFEEKNIEYLALFSKK